MCVGLVDQHHSGNVERGWCLISWSLPIHCIFQPLWVGLKLMCLLGQLTDVMVVTLREAGVGLVEDYLFAVNLFQLLWVILKANLVVPILVYCSCFSFGGNIHDWFILYCILYFLMGFVVWSGCDVFYFWFCFLSSHIQTTFRVTRRFILKQSVTSITNFKQIYICIMFYICG